MSIYSSLSYRELVEKSLRKSQKLGRKPSYSGLAAEAKIGPSYFTNVMKERGHFSADQLFAICQALHLNEEECEFALLLLEHERSAHSERKQSLKRRIREIREVKSKTHTELAIVSPNDLAEREQTYYLEPIHLLVHVGFSIPRFAANPTLLKRLFGLDDVTFAGIFDFLQRNGYLELTPDGKIRQREKVRHLTEDSRLCRAHQAMMREWSLGKLAVLPNAQKRTVQAVFSAGEEDFVKIRAEITAMLDRIKEIAVRGSAEKIYGIQLDFFPWA